MVGSPTTLAWIALASPLVASVAITLGTRQWRRTSSGIAVASILISFLCALCILAQRPLHDTPQLVSELPWIQLPGVTAPLGIMLDHLALLMLLVVTGVGGAICIFSIGYMAHDTGYSRYFAALSFFAFSMLGIVLASNWITMFICWELVGFCSYLLIGHWYHRPSAAEAGKKAFMVNRVADFGFLIGILWLWALSGANGADRTFSFFQQEAIFTAATPHGLLPLVGLLLFCGVLGKSAQFPLHVWLPDAMEGPTPVSALIHAATMVAAGVYLLCRSFFLFEHLAMTLTVIAWIGAFTALFAASIAVVQNDIKRILAYSTLSQLGYMVMALGLGGAVVGMFHLTTHAFFKALLFLGAGSIIHALHDEQDIRRMGGLWRKLPVTSATFLIGTAALCGLFPFSGFWSKDEILSLALTHDHRLYLIGTFTAGLTALYMGRCIFTAFFGETRATREPHESPAVMTGPLVFLAVLSVIGAWGIPSWLHRQFPGHVEPNIRVAIASNVVAWAGLALAYIIYLKRLLSAAAIRARLAWLSVLLERKCYIDELYSWLVLSVQQRIARACRWFEQRIIIATCVNGVATCCRAAGSVLRLLQSGAVQTSIVVFVAGLTALIYWMVF